jgi:hypothetical protein
MMVGNPAAFAQELPMGSGIAERAAANARRGQPQERREVAFNVRAKTGPGNRDWTGVGVAFERRNGLPGYSVKLNTVPISKDWNGALVLVPPFVDDDEPITD